VTTPVRINVSRKDLFALMHTMIAARDYFGARDAAKSVEQLLNEVKPSPIYLECDQAVDRLAKILDPQGQQTR